ncbi:hypothetical protein ERICIV_00870 [Paenibacillus larvae subsp. larvae]|uniref:Uncharacterized protein n=1 Tax=Paenibacillus larvae subsp. larvae TaxID=147375 RepID=A0A2L1TWQ1_9BACL|nr:hypothetical protein [Paenibacillus larvae]AQT85672.1 hypothetical protein B1222_16695 [Paenibacillus larvae subsp. pulvifaciens]AVF25074.1 hypothetical protein ERICIII_00867 [Paenibacillus larvae subsp. larvae]AVF29838.1 hypothetical protein ERICIV_00870 [Paenibacillus larvae subsp. larvae]MBH0341221.1 hypothetical protein [Paenibacillus larvae]MCY7522364.1 hypothetical protein [Paenibacillus larvae]
MNEITEKQREEMKHALGLNYSDEPTRNYFYTDSNDTAWNDLVKKGLARKRNGWDDESSYFHLTDKGISMVTNTWIE